jgi:hypothetical protein
VSTSCYVGAADPHNPHLVRARYVHSDGHPHRMIETLHHIWATTAHLSTTTLIEVILAHDWDYLDACTDAGTTSGLSGQYPVVGVGMTLAATTPGGSLADPEPVSVFPLSRAGELDAAWIYLLDPATDTATVHTDDGEPVGVHPLTA